MNRKHFLSVLVMLLFYGQIFCQKSTAVNYQKSSQVTAFVQSSEALQVAGQSYVQLVEKVFSDQGIAIAGKSYEDTQRRQTQYDWMVRVAPYLLVGTKNQKQTMNSWMAEFGEEFGLSLENREKITKGLTNYLDAYSKYWAVITDLQNSKGKGKKTPPTAPPPPPPTQQHHRG